MFLKKKETNLTSDSENHQVKSIMQQEANFPSGTSAGLKRKQLITQLCHGGGKKTHKEEIISFSKNIYFNQMMWTMVPKLASRF